MKYNCEMKYDKITERLPTEGSLKDGTWQDCRRTKYTRIPEDNMKHGYK
jgi:hypothetical protein